MGGIFFLFLMAVYVAIATLLILKFPRFKIFIISFFIVLAIGDEVYGRYKLKKMCESDSGIHIYETVKNVDGFETNYYFYADWLKYYGYKYIENDEKIMTVSSNGQAIISSISINQSSYMLHRTEREITSIEGWYYIRTQYIFRKYDQKILSKNVSMGYSGGWATRLLQSIYATKTPSIHCADSRNSLENLVIQTLQPTP